MAMAMGWSSPLVVREKIPTSDLRDGGLSPNSTRIRAAYRAVLNQQELS
jgi:hypothetical protein